jgi:hypothetical protein
LNNILSSILPLQVNYLSKVDFDGLIVQLPFDGHQIRVGTLWRLLKRVSVMIGRYLTSRSRPVPPDCVPMLKLVVGLVVSMWAEELDVTKKYFEREQKNLQHSIALAKEEEKSRLQGRAGKAGSANAKETGGKGGKVATPSHTCSLAHTPTTQPPNHPTREIVS